MDKVNFGGVTVQFKNNNKGLLDLEDVAGVMGFSMEQMNDWLNDWTHPVNRGLVEINGKCMVRKKVALSDWFEAQWIRHGLDKNRFPYPKCKGIKEWRRKIHELSVTTVKQDRKNRLKSLSMEEDLYL